MPETQTIEQISTGRRIAPHGVELGAPRVTDGAAICRLVEASKPLDVNSTYAYLLLCTHFAETCVLATSGGRTVGFVSAYRPPQARDVIFVWQVAVDAEQRGSGLGGSMLRDLLARKAVAGCRYLEATVSPSNKPSRRLFLGLARDLDAPIEERVLFDEADFGESRHEVEILIRIGPFTAQPTKGGEPQNAT